MCRVLSPADGHAALGAAARLTLPMLQLHTLRNVWPLLASDAGVAGTPVALPVVAAAIFGKHCLWGSSQRRVIYLDVIGSVSSR